ncbi:nuclear transport factor 2 family protein [Mycobacterium sp. NPDC048908]|uniref:nuclear transport factor 2 family protein n=1 Tax=Mycobacterium sp. NPDC048908 TaxID=3364292 RepID=UPI00371679E7
MMRKAEFQRRLLHATLVLGIAAALGGAIPAAHAATVTDPDAETAAVELLKATYFDDVDTKNWLALRQLFAPDAVVDTTGSFGPYFPNRDSFIAFTSLTLSPINTRHQGYDPQISLTSDTTASAVWTMHDRLSLAGLVTIHGYGHYTDNYQQVDGQWRITYSKLTRTRFALEFPAFEKFAIGLPNAYQSGGPVAGLLYAGPALVDIPVSAVRQVVGAVASNFGGPPAKAQQITVPPGSTGVTTEPPAVSTAPSARAVTLRTLAVTTQSKSSGSNTTQVAADSVGATATSPKSHHDVREASTSATKPTTHRAAKAGSGPSNGSRHVSWPKVATASSAAALTAGRAAASPSRERSTSARVPLSRNRYPTPASD